MRDGADALQEQAFCRSGIVESIPENDSVLRITMTEGQFWEAVLRECAALGVNVPLASPALDACSESVALDVRTIRRTHRQTVLSEIDATEMKLWSGTIVQFHGRSTLGLMPSARSLEVERTAARQPWSLAASKRMKKRGA